MLCAFTTKDGETLVIRSDDIRMLLDRANGSRLTWVIGADAHDMYIQGSARENAARIQQEELDLIARIEDHRAQLQRRMSEGYPAVPVKRGRP